MKPVLPWFRLYTEFATDPVVQMLAFEDQRHFVMALCMKGSGILDKSYPNDDFKARIISATLGLDPVACSEASRRLQEAGLIDSKWQPVKWEKRQMASDHSAAERKRKQRERDSHDDVTADGCDSHSLDKSREDKKRKKPSLRSRRVPDEFMPDLEHARDQLPNVDAEAEALKFREWEFATPKSDWSLTWKRWIRRCREKGEYAKLGDGGVKWR